MPDNSPKDQAEQVDQVPVGRGDNGRFLPGYSGNPAGRPRNPRTLAKRLAEGIFDADAAALSRKAVELALAGDPVSLRFCLSRIIGPSREHGVDIGLPPVRGADDVAAAMTAVTDAATAGEISPREGADFARMVDSIIRSLDLHHVERRIRDLESAYDAIRNHA
jgi:hypothetical protein